MKLTTLLNERQRRLAKWNDKVSPIAEWLSEKEELLSTPLSDSLDYDSAEKHKNQFVVRKNLLRQERVKSSIIRVHEKFLKCTKRFTHCLFVMGH